MTDSAAKRDDVSSDLLMALLAVNSWTLERVSGLYESLRKNGLFDVSILSGLTPEQIQGRLSAAGYERGPVLGRMIASRVQNLAVALFEGGDQLLVDCEASRDISATRAYLLQLHGVGLTVVENYLLLRSSAAS